MMELLGLPPYKMLIESKRANKFFTSECIPRYCEKYEDSNLLGIGRLKGSFTKRGKYRGPPGSKSLVDDLKEAGNDILFVDFIRRCLEFNPDDRMKPREALKHQWIKRKYISVNQSDENPLSNESRDVIIIDLSLDEKQSEYFKKHDSICPVSSIDRNRNTKTNLPENIISVTTGDSVFSSGDIIS